MAARTMWKGAISLGLVVIPVKMNKATESHDAAFHELHSGCGGRVGRAQFCKVCGEKNGRVTKLDTASIVKGYEVSKDIHVLFSEQDFENLPLSTVKAIEIQNFISAEEIDPILYENTYYLTPEDIGAKTFNLLSTVLAEENRIAIAKVVVSRKEQLCALRSNPTMGGTCKSGIVLSTMLYSDEIREMPSTPTSADPTTSEKDMLTQIVGKMTEPFDHTKYHDTYAEAVQELVTAKTEGKTLTPVAEKKQTLSLEEALKQTLES